MTVAEAAQVWAEEKQEIDRRKSRLDAAAETLKAYFRKTGKNNYRGRIGYAHGVQRRLDTAKVKAELGDRYDDFKHPVPYESLSLLK